MNFICSIRFEFHDERGWALFPCQRVNIKKLPFSFQFLQADGRYTLLPAVHHTPVFLFVSGKDETILVEKPAWNSPVVRFIPVWN